MSQYQPYNQSVSPSNQNLEKQQNVHKKEFKQQCIEGGHALSILDLICIDPLCANPGVICLVCSQTTHKQHEIMNLNMFIHQFKEKLQQQQIYVKLSSEQQLLKEEQSNIRKTISNLNQQFQQEIKLFTQQMEVIFSSDINIYDTPKQIELEYINKIKILDNWKNGNSEKKTLEFIQEITQQLITRLESIKPNLKIKDFMEEAQSKYIKKIYKRTSLLNKNVDSEVQKILNSSKKYFEYVLKFLKQNSLFSQHQQNQKPLNNQRRGSSFSDFSHQINLADLSYHQQDVSTIDQQHQKHFYNGQDPNATHSYSQYQLQPNHTINNDFNNLNQPHTQNNYQHQQQQMMNNENQKFQKVIQKPNQQYQFAGINNNNNNNQHLDYFDNDIYIEDSKVFKPEMQFKEIVDKKKIALTSPLNRSPSNRSPRALSPNHSQFSSIQVKTNSPLYPKHYKVLEQSIYNNQFSPTEKSIRTNSIVTKNREQWPAHNKPVNDIIFVDKDILASAGQDNQIKLWDKIDPKFKNILLEGHQQSVNCLDYNQNLGILASGSDDKSIFLWKQQLQWKPIFILRGHQERVNAVKFYNNDRFLISASNDKTCRVWDIEKGFQFKALSLNQHQQQNTISQQEKEQMNFNCIEILLNQVLFVGSFKFIFCWDLTTFQPIKYFQVHQDKINKLLLLPKMKNNNYCLLTAGMDNSVKILEFNKNLELIKKIPDEIFTDLPVYSLAFIGDQEQIVVGMKDTQQNRGKVYIWKKSNLQVPYKQLTENSSAANQLLWDQQLKLLFSCHDNNSIEYNII